MRSDALLPAGERHDLAPTSTRGYVAKYPDARKRDIADHGLDDEAQHSRGADFHRA